MRINKRIIACTHHKTGTALFNEILKNISKKFNLKFQVCEQNELNKDTDIWLQWHSRINFDTILYPYVGSHIIRDPRDIVISGYFYHLKCSENWTLAPQVRLNNKSYQDYLKNLSFEEGLVFEMNNTAKQTIINIINWAYNNPNIIEVRMEDILTNYERTFDTIFRFYGFTGKHHDTCMKIANKSNANNFSTNKIIQSNHIQSLEINKWKKYFNDVHKEEFKKLFGDVLVQLKYEKDNNW